MTPNLATSSAKKLASRIMVPSGRPCTPAKTCTSPLALGSLGYKAAGAPDGLPALVSVPLAILDLLCIHPFRDGNGRAARLATLLLLYRQGYAVGRYISLERIFEESKESYYETLEHSSQGCG